VDPLYSTPPSDQDWWQKLLNRARDVAERIEGRVLRVLNKHAPNGADGGAGPAEPEGGTPHPDGG
jgi:hypothetical protein